MRAHSSSTVQAPDRRRRPTSDRSTASRWAPTMPPPPAPCLALDVSRAGGTVVVTVGGELDLASSALLADLLRDLIGDQGNLAVGVDVADMVVVDPDGLVVLLDATTLSRARGGMLSLCGASRAQYKMLDHARTAKLPDAMGDGDRGPACGPDRTTSASRLQAMGRHPSSDMQPAPRTFPQIQADLP